MYSKKTEPINVSKGALGTFAGVFTPSVLTILGIILFLRLGYVVGNAGLGRALIMIGLANAISVLTSISLAAIATNLKVKGGGDYYLISRTLGVEFGGAIGVVLFLAQSVSIAFYCIGFGEAIVGITGDIPWLSTRIVAAGAVSLLFILAWMGADWATRFQYVVMALLAAALFSFFSGGLPRWETARLAQNWGGPEAGPPFWVLFAIFFPAVTGFTQGVSMSGDLKDPGKSLPLGTFFAVGVSIVVYFGSAILFAGVLPRENLAQDYASMWGVARFGFLIDAGVVAATLSSAVASFLGAPRILQSLARDRIFPFLTPFSKGVGPSNNPRRGVLLSAGIAFITVAFGNLNLIAPVVSMFFLISYGLLNYATFFEVRTASPSFRPRFRWFDYRLSLVGSLACLGAMLAIDLTAGIVAVAVLFAIFQYLRRTAGPARWADSRRSYHLQHMKEHLQAASAEPEHPRDWRPQILAFSDHMQRREQLLAFASWIQGGSGLITAVRMLEGEGMKMNRLREEAEEELRKDAAVQKAGAFSLVVLMPTVQSGLPVLLQSFGVGPLKANTVLLNYLGSTQKGIFGIGEAKYSKNLRAAFRMGCNIIVLVADERKWSVLQELPGSGRRIDVWWSGDKTGTLMLLMAYLITRHENWQDAGIRLVASGYGDGKTPERETLLEMLESFRIEADPQVVSNPDAQSITQNSGDAALAIVPFRIHENRISLPFGTTMEDLMAGGPLTALVLAAEDVDLDAEPESGAYGEVAGALDTLEDAQKVAREAEKETTQAIESAEEADRRMQQILESARPGMDREKMMEIEEAIEEAKKAREEVLKKEKKAAKAKARVLASTRDAEKLGVIPAEEK